MTETQLKRLSGIVQGKKRSYLVEVRPRPSKSNQVELDSLFEVVVSIAAAETPIKTDVLSLKPDDPDQALQWFVESIKGAASKDFE